MGVGLLLNRGKVDAEKSLAVVVAAANSMAMMGEDGARGCACKERDGLEVHYALVPGG